MNIKLDNENINVEDNKSIIELFGDKLKGNNHIIACDINNEIKTLNYIPKENDNVSFVDVTSRDGRRTYIRGLLFIMSMAFNECYPEAFLSVNYQLTNAMYCEVDNLKVTREMIENVSKKMKEIVSKKLDIKKVEMSKEEAIKFYEKENSLRGILQLDNEQKKGVSLYFCEGYYNYFYGVMPINTEYINVFEIVPYNDGILLRYPDKSNPNALEAGVASKKMIAILDEYKDIHRVLDVNTIYKLNKQIREGKSAELVLLAEALHEKKISDIADNVVKRKNVKVILIAGPSSSGKTTFAKRLGIQLRLNGLKPVTI